MASPTTPIPGKLDVNRILDDVRSLHQKVTGRPFQAEEGRPPEAPLPPGVDPVELLNEEYHSLMNLASAGYLRPAFAAPYAWSPPAEVFQTRKECWVRVDLPGVDKHDVSLKTQGQVLLVRGERRFRSNETDHNHLLMERAYGSFVKEIPLPELVNTKAIEASLDGGVLEVRIPRREPSDEVADRDIEIH